MRGPMGIAMKIKPTKLQYAVHFKNPAWVKRLLAEGHDPNQVEPFYHEWYREGLSLVQAAVRDRSGEVARLLVDAGATGPTHYMCQFSGFRRLEGSKVVNVLPDIPSLAPLTPSPLGYLRPITR